MKYQIILLSIFLFVGHAFANEPLWTDIERAEKRDIIIQGEVQSTDKHLNIDEHDDLYKAKIKVIQVYKGNPELKGEILDIYYEFSTTGKNIRCPAYVELKQGDSGKIFIIELDEEWKKHNKPPRSKLRDIN